jgi:hypothetical protein
MRTFAKVFEYLLVVALGSSIAYGVATYAATQVSASFNQMSGCIDNPTKDTCG